MGQLCITSKGPALLYNPKRASTTVSPQKGQHCITPKEPALYHPKRASSVSPWKGQFCITLKGPALYHPENDSSVSPWKGQLCITLKGPVLYHPKKASTVSHQKGQYCITPKGPVLYHPKWVANAYISLHNISVLVMFVSTGLHGEWAEWLLNIVTYWTPHWRLLVHTMWSQTPQTCQSLSE